jgi:hypothetical protein
LCALTLAGIGLVSLLSGCGGAREERLNAEMIIEGPVTIKYFQEDIINKSDNFRLEVYDNTGRKRALLRSKSDSLRDENPNFIWENPNFIWIDENGKEYASITSSAEATKKVQIEYRN